MKRLSTTKSSSKQPTSDTAVSEQSQFQSRPFATNTGQESQNLIQTSKETKHQGFNFANIPILPGMRPASQSKGLSINADSQLEAEADAMGAKFARRESAQVPEVSSLGVQRQPQNGVVVQCMTDEQQTLSDQIQHSTSPALRQRSVQMLLNAGISLPDLHTSGLTLQQLLGGNITSQAIMNAGFTPRQMFQDGITSMYMAVDNIPLSQLFNGGITPQEMLQDGITLQEMLQDGITPQQLLQAGITPQQMQAGGITLLQQFNAGVTPPQMLQAGITPQQMQTDGITLLQQFNAGVTPQQMVQAGITPQEMHTGGITPQQMLADGITPQQMLTGGVTAAQMLADGITPQQMLTDGITLHQQFVGGVTPQEMLADGIMPQEMLTGGITLLEQYNGGVIPQQMLANRITPLQMAGAGITLLQQFNGGVTPKDFMKAGLTPQYLMNQGLTLQDLSQTATPITPQELKKAGIKRQEMRDVGIVPPEKNSWWKRGKESRGQVAAAIKEHEASSDVAKNLGNSSKDTSHNLGAYATEGDNVAVIGATRDQAKFLAILQLPEVIDKAKAVWKGEKDGKKMSKKERVRDGSDAAGTTTSVLTYGGVVGEQIAIGAGAGNGSHDMVDAAKNAGKLVGGGIPTIVGKVGASGLGAVAKGAGSIVSYQKDKSDGYTGGKFYARRGKDALATAQGVSSTVKDAAAFAGTAGTLTQQIAGGYVTPGLGIAVGGIESVQGGYKFNKARKNQNRLGNIPVSPGHQATIASLQERQKKQQKRALAKTGYGAASMTAGAIGIAGTAFPPLLIAATVLGASIGGVKLTHWLYKKVRQKGRDKGWTGFNADKSSNNKIIEQQQLLADTLSVFEELANPGQQAQLLKAMGLNQARLDLTIQTAYRKATNDPNADMTWANLPADTRRQVMEIVTTQLLAKR